MQFVMRTENLDFIDALKLLADNAGIIIPEDDGNFSDASHEKKKRDFGDEQTFSEIFL